MVSISLLHSVCPGLAQLSQERSAWNVAVALTPPAAHLRDVLFSSTPGQCSACGPGLDDRPMSKAALMAGKI